MTKILYTEMVIVAYEMYRYYLRCFLFAYNFAFECYYVESTWLPYFRL